MFPSCKMLVYEQQERFIMGNNEWMLIAVVIIAILLGISIMAALQGKRSLKKSGRASQNQTKRGTTNRA